MKIYENFEAAHHALQSYMRLEGLIREMCQVTLQGGPPYVEVYYKDEMGKTQVLRMLP